MNSDIVKFVEGQTEVELLLSKHHALAKNPTVSKLEIVEPWNSKMSTVSDIVGSTALPLPIFAVMSATEQTMPVLFLAACITNVVVLTLGIGNLAFSSITGKNLVYRALKKFGRRKDGINKIERAESAYELKMEANRKSIEQNQKKRDKIMHGTSQIVEKLNSNNLKYSFDFTEEKGLVVKEREDTAPLFKVLEVMKKARIEEAAPVVLAP